MFDFTNGRLPEAFKNTWIFNRDIEGYRLRNQDDIYLQRFNYNSLRSHPFFYLPEIWNNMKNDFKNFPNRRKFLDCLKKLSFHKLEPNFTNNCYCELCSNHLQNLLYNMNDHV